MLKLVKNLPGAATRGSPSPRATSVYFKDVLSTVQTGFTLVELLVVISIMAILTALATPSMISFVGNWQTSNAVNSLSGSLQLARSEAIKRGRTVRICRSGNGTTCAAGTNNANGGWKSGWIVYVDNDASGGLNANDEVVLVQNTVTGMNDITSNSVGLSNFAFAQSGLMQNGVGSQGMNFSWDAAGTIRKALCISFTGRARVVADNTDCAGNS
jgi:type IV fimbrial biogenesis protein FimT